MTQGLFSRHNADKRRYAKYKNSGGCIRCGKEREDKLFKMCKRCRSYFNNRKIK
jgi:hypothetical protein